MISQNPTNKNISLHNCQGELDVGPLVKQLLEETCPRILIFENSLPECGLRYLEITNVSQYIFIFTILIKGFTKFKTVTRAKKTIKTHSLLYQHSSFGLSFMCMWSKFAEYIFSMNNDIGKY